MFHSNNSKQFMRNGYSLLEMLVTLAIVAIIMLMITNILVISLRVSLEINERSLVREEMSEIISRIRLDVRSANLVSQDCINDGTICTLKHNTENIRWQSCTGEFEGESIVSICRYTVDPISGAQTLDFQSSNRINFASPAIDFSDLSDGNIMDTTEDRSQATFSVTLIGSHSNEDLEIENIYRQSVVSTRNYRI